MALAWMPTKSLGKKAARVLTFTMGVRNKGVAATLSAHGFTDEELAEGWQKLSALTMGRLGTKLSAVLDPDALVAIDTWENKWFPIAQASLAARFPEIHDVVFLNLAQTEGPEVIISVDTLIKRLARLSETEEGKAALALLAKRGVTEAVIAQAQALVTKLSTVDNSPAVVGVTPEEDALREAAMWSWYREWSKIARTVISDRRQLRALGFLDASGKATADDAEDDVDEEEDLDDDSDDADTDATDPPINGGTTRGAAGASGATRTTGGTPGTTPGPTNGTTPAKPKIEPGMPGADPFDDEPPA